MNILTFLVLTNLTFVIGQNVMIGKEEASKFLRRNKRANKFFLSEILEGNAERECIEEVCNFEEAREVFENLPQTILFWRRLKDQCSTNLNECYREGTFRCQSLYNSHRCYCKNGFVGKRCQTRIYIDRVNVCERHVNLCMNGGTCVDEEDDFYYCRCPLQWYGISCERDYDECMDDGSCVNGNCTNTFGSYECACREGYRGGRCQLAEP